MDFTDGFTITIIFVFLAFLIGEILVLLGRAALFLVCGAVALVALPFVYGYTKFTERKKEAK